MAFFAKRLLILAALAASITGSLAQMTTTTPPSTRTTMTTTLSRTSTTSAPAATITVKVGLQHDFQPDVIRAKVGDVIHFDFFPKNHSVVKAEFKNPCIPYDYVTPGGQMFYSGSMESQPGDTPPSWELTVNDTSPTFFYCSAPGSCIDWAMIGVINPNSTVNLDIQKEYQKLVTFQLSPGEDFPDEGDTGVNDPNPSASPSPNPPTQSGGGSGSNLSAGAIAGIAIGGAAVIIMLIALIYLCGRKGGIEKGYRQSTILPKNHGPMLEANYFEPYNPSKSPAPPSSPYGAQTETWRSSLAPSHFTANAVSPHASFMGQPGHGQQQGHGFAPQHTGQSSELDNAYDPHHSIPPPPPQQPPVELPDNSHR